MENPNNCLDQAMFAASHSYSVASYESESVCAETDKEEEMTVLSDRIAA